MNNRVYTAVKLSQEERKILETIAKSYDITISDVIRIAIKEYARKHRNVLEKINEGGGRKLRRFFSSSKIKKRGVGLNGSD